MVKTLLPHAFSMTTVLTGCFAMLLKDPARTNGTTQAEQENTIHKFGNRQVLRPTAPAGGNLNPVTSIPSTLTSIKDGPHQEMAVGSFNGSLQSCKSERGFAMTESSTGSFDCDSNLLEIRDDESLNKTEMKRVNLTEALTTNNHNLVDISHTDDSQTVKNSDSHDYPNSFSGLDLWSNDSDQAIQVATVSFHPSDINSPQISTQVTTIRAPSTTQGSRVGTLDFFIFVYTYCYLLVYPIIGITGLVGNTISAFAVVKSGLEKPSNVLLFGLAIADCCCLMRAINIGYMLPFLPGKIPGYWLIWEFDYIPAHAIYVIYTIMENVGKYGKDASSSLTVLITIERCVAVFFPLKFTQIVTPKRVWFVMTAVFIFWLPIHMCNIFRYQFFHAFSPAYGIYAGLLATNPKLWYNDVIDLEWFYDTFINQLGGTVSMIIVFTGCTAIGIRLSIAAKRREKIITKHSKKTNSNRTMRTLLIICFVYFLCRVCFVFFYLIPEFTIATRKYRFFAWTFPKLMDALIYVNSASNFFIYIIFNKRLRILVIEMCCGCFLRKKAKNAIEQQK